MQFTFKKETLAQSHLCATGQPITPQQVNFFEATVPYLEIAYRCGATGARLQDYFPWLEATKAIAKHGEHTNSK